MLSKPRRLAIAGWQGAGREALTLTGRLGVNSIGKRTLYRCLSCDHYTFCTQSRQEAKHGSTGTRLS